MTKQLIPDRITARSVHERLEGKVDPHLHFVLVAMAEDLHTQRKEIKSLAEAFTTIADVLNALTNFNHDIKSMLESRRDDLDEVTSPYVQAEAPEEKET